MSHDQNHDLSPRKKAVFTGVAIAIPFLVLLMLELILNVSNYGGNLDLFIKQKTGTVTEYVLNKDFTKRYFFQKGIKTPIPLSQTFSAEKDSSTYRVFCLGASTTQGFPYPPNGGYPAILENMLTDVLPHRNIEVVNCGITAITSHSVLDMEREVLKKYQPDLLIIYSGHNEFYGVFGQASTFSLFQNRALLNMFLKMQRSRLVLLTRNTLNSIFGKRIKGDSKTQSPTLMSIMAKDVGIRLDSDTVRRTQRQYRENLKDMCKLAIKNQTDIMLCTLADNQLDLPPFASVHAREFAAQDTTAWHDAVQQAHALQQSKDFQAAIEQYQKALRIDSTFAETHFAIAQCYLAENDVERAAYHFQCAKDYDTIRFRAPSTFNDVIEQVSDVFDVPLINIKAAFDEASPNGIPGFNLLHEHVHPNLAGYTLMAKTMASAMYKNELLPHQWDWTAARSDSGYMEATHLSLLDHEVVNYSLFRLMSQWPFPPPDSTPVYRRIGTPRTEQLAKSFIEDNNKSLVELHLDYGNEFHQKNELDAALREYEAALAIQPLAITYNRIGRVYLRMTEQLVRNQQDYESAAQSFQNGVLYFSKGLERWPDDIQLRFNLGLLYLMRQDQIAASIEQFQKVLELDAKHKNAYIQLVQVYLRQRDLPKAKTLLERALKLFPDEARFYTDLGLIYAQEKNIPEAKKWLNQAVQMSNDSRAQSILQQLP